MHKQLSGLEKQDAFLTAIYSRPLHCPVCNGHHSLIEARGSEDWSKILPVKCPTTDKPLVHQVPLLGDDYFTVPLP